MKRVCLCPVFLAVWLALALGAVVHVRAQWASEEDVCSYVNTMNISSSVKDLVCEAFQKGLADGRLTLRQAESFLKSVNQSGAKREDREAVLTLVARALLEDLPVEMLINKVQEGLKRGVSMDAIAAEIQERKQTLQEVKDLLDQKGIRIQDQAGQPGFSREAVDAAITDIAAVLEDHVRGGKDPNDGASILMAVQIALKNDGRIPADLRAQLLSVLTPADLSRIAQNISKRLS